MARKHFSKELHADNDELCRTAVKTLLKNSQYSCEDNPKKMGVDLLLYKDGKHIGYIETERKIVWKGASFPYDNVNFLYRKLKYAMLDMPTFFVMFSADMKNFLTVTSKDLMNSPVEEVRNKYVFKEEMFFKVPLDKVSFNDILTVLNKKESK